MTPRTRLDKVVKLRERAEDRAAANLATAQASLDRALRRLATATKATLADERRAGPVSLWEVDDTARRRELVVLEVARAVVAEAEEGQAEACAGYGVARREAEVVRRVADRKVAAILQEGERREQRGLDEIAALGFVAAK